MGSPLVSVIVPAHNAVSDLTRFFSALRAQTASADQFEVLVIDDCSTDATRELVRSEPLATLIESAERIGPYRARNVGLEHARGELLVFTDADCIPAEDWIERGIARLAPGTFAMVAGGIDIPVGDKPGGTALLDSARHLNQRLYVERGFGATANLWVTREVIKRVGTFNPRIASGGDTEFGQRACSLGAELTYAPDVLVAHPPRRRARDLVRKTFRIGVGSTQQALHAEGPLAEKGVRLWAHPRAYLPKTTLSGAARLEENGYRLTRLRLARLLLLQYVLVTLPVVLGSLTGALRESRAQQARP